MQNNDITVRVRGLDEATGTYGDVDLSAYNIVGFAGEIIGPAGWLTEEELENGVIARHIHISNANTAVRFSVSRNIRAILKEIVLVAAVTLLKRHKELTV